MTIRFVAEVIGYVHYINILTWLRVVWVKIINLLCFFCLSFPKREFKIQRKQNIDISNVAYFLHRRHKKLRVSLPSTKQELGIYLCLSLKAGVNVKA